MARPLMKESGTMRAAGQAELPKVPETT